jgi:hypothetical protein
MQRTRSLLVLTALLALALASAAAAGTYTVTLKNGTTFETRYKPVDADWDDSILMLSSDRGNWIALLKEDVVDVTSSVEETGFGYQVNTTTIFVGWAPNEALPEGQEGEGGEGGGTGNPALDALPDPYAAQDFSLEQFVDPSIGASSQPVRNY